MRVLLCLSLLVCAASAASFFDLVVEEWATWKLLHGKNYSSTTDEKYRMKIFVENRAMIERHNALYHQGQKSFSMKINHYGDMLPHEFRTVMNGYKYNMKKSSPHTPALFLTPNHVTLPKSIDWRTKGYVTPVKNQGQCGSCWAFSTTGALEGQHFRKTGKLTSLSEQNLVDCSRKFGNNGCEGGLMDFGFAYIKQNKGIDTEASYPYEGIDDKCHYDASKKGAWDVGFVDVPQGDEEKLKEAVGTVGPVSIAIDASQESFQFYHKGIYKDDGCSPRNLDHGVLCVGYGEEENGDKYWLVKNSWSEQWGDEGYIKMARDDENMCGIASSASYPLV